MQLSRSFAVASWRVLVLALVLGIISCSNGPGGDKLYPVTGKIMYKDQPAAGAMVTFHPKHAKNQLAVHRPYGVAKDDGTFVLVTGRDQGAAAGEYAVTVVWYQEPPAKKGKGISTGGDDAPSVDKLKGKFAEQSESKITMYIKEGSNQLDPIVLR